MARLEDLKLSNDDGDQVGRDGFLLSPAPPCLAFSERLGTDAFAIGHHGEAVCDDDINRPTALDSGMIDARK